MSNKNQLETNNEDMFNKNQFNNSIKGNQNKNINPDIISKDYNLSPNKNENDEKISDIKYNSIISKEINKNNINKKESNYDNNIIIDNNFSLNNKNNNNDKENNKISTKEINNNKTKGKINDKINMNTVQNINNEIEFIRDQIKEKSENIINTINTINQITKKKTHINDNYKKALLFSINSGFFKPRQTFKIYISSPYFYKNIRKEVMLKKYLDKMEKELIKLNYFILQHVSINIYLKNL